MSYWKSFFTVERFRPFAARAAVIRQVAGTTRGGLTGGVTLFRDEAEGFCAAIMACFEELEPSREEFLHDPEEETTRARLLRLAEGVISRAGVAEEVKVATAEFEGGKCGVDLRLGWMSASEVFDASEEDGAVESHVATALARLLEGREWSRKLQESAHSGEAQHRRISGLLVSTAAPLDLSEEDLRGIEEDLQRTREAMADDTEAVRKIIRDTTHLGECFSSEDEEHLLRWAYEEPAPEEPYWQKSFTITPPPEGLEGGLAETAVVVQAKHGGPVPMTASQVEEFVDAIENAAIAGEQERMNRLADLDPIDDRARKPEDPVEVPEPSGEGHACISHLALDLHNSRRAATYAAWRRTLEEIVEALRPWEDE